MAKKSKSAKQDKKKVMVFIGTSKGGVVLTSGPKRKKWQVSDLLFKSWRVMHMNLDVRHQRLHAALAHDVYGPSTHYSDDYGASWTQAQQVPTFRRASASGRPPGTPTEAADEGSARDTPEKILKVWNITPGRDSEPGVLYAGAEPAALFKSQDNGQTWTLNEALYDHPHRQKWFPGAGGLCLHTIIPDPSSKKRMYIAISAGGCYYTGDSGLTWEARNKNVRADFLPDKFPEFGQCVHKIAIHPSQPQVLYQQNHCGIYRSDNAGKDWIDIGEGRLPSRFGFPIAVHPHDPQTIYVVLEESDEYHLSVDDRFAVWRSQDAGETWRRLTKGLPKRAHLVVLREAMALDNLDEPGVYVGTNTGQLFYSPDAGDNWDLLVDFLPPILSVEAAVVG